MVENNELHFKTNVQLKSIIGKDLINDDNIAILELVKNAFDADAKKVTITYSNLKENDDKIAESFSENSSRLIIKDDGLGMGINDIENKWLNIAYSEKKTNTRQHNRMMAGAKGVGRFSCDRLGEFLILYAKKKNDEKFVKLTIDWKKFEIEDENKEIQSVGLKHETISDDQLKKASIDPFDQGVVLEIIKLRSSWAYPIKNKKGDIERWDIEKFVELKKYLEKLINPNQAFEENDFGIFMNAPEFRSENDGLPKHEKFIGKVENTIFDKLDFKSTSIESKILENGEIIFTELKDKGETIFWIKERNQFYPDIKNATITLYFLNTYAKTFFTRQTGIQSVNYGSIFLFINGFRIPPYGEVGNDWLSLDQRKVQGPQRYLGIRDLVGRIEILDEKNDFPIISSREGIAKNDNYKKLANPDRNNSYFHKTLRRLERYVVEGLSWDSSKYTPGDPEYRELERKILDGTSKDEELEFRETDQTKKTRVYHAIHSILSAKTEDVIELYINEDLILEKIEEERSISEREFQQLINDFDQKKIDAETLNRILEKKAEQNAELEKQIKDFAKYTTNEATTKALLELQNYKETVEKQTQTILALRSELEEIKSQKVSAENLATAYKEQVEQAAVEVERVTAKLEAEKKKGAFQGALIGTDKERIISMQHQVFHSSSRIHRNLKLLIKKLVPKTLDEATKKYIKVISLEASKINSIANFITKANFNLKASEIEIDLVDFAMDYLNEVYIHEDAVIDTNLRISIVANGSSFIKTIRPLEITTVLDNFISNAEKAKASFLNFTFLKSDSNLQILIEDDGQGIRPEDINEIFDLGYTTTDGSGIGLYQVRDIIVNNMKGTITVNSVVNRGTTFKLTIP